MKTELAQNALQSGTLWKRCFRVYVWTNENELFENAEDTLSVSIHSAQYWKLIQDGGQALPFLVLSELSFNTYASSMSIRVSYRFQIDSWYACGRAKTMRKRYEWTRIFWKRRKKVAFSNEYGSVWTAPKTTSDQNHFCFLSLHRSQIFLFTKPETWRRMQGAGFQSNDCWDRLSTSVRTWLVKDIQI